MKILNKKSLVVLLVVGFVAQSGWLHFKVNQMTKLNKQQTREILTQCAAWKVIISSLDEESQTKFMESLNKVLQEQ
jgi:hypothetical protein